VPYLVAAGALDQRGGSPRSDEFDTAAEHTYPFAGRPLADLVVGVQDGSYDGGGGVFEVGWVALPVWGDAERSSD
jgi:hypothetical protein